MKTYSIGEIRTYILSQNSLGDVLYNLSEENIERAVANDKLNELTGKKILVWEDLETTVTKVVGEKIYFLDKEGQEWYVDQENEYKVIE